MQINPDVNPSGPLAPTFKLGRISLPGLGLRVSERRLLLLIVDLLLINGALIATLVITREYPLDWFFFWVMSKWFVSLSILWLMVANYFDCYDLAVSASMPVTARHTGQAVLVTLLLYTLLPWFTPPLSQRTPIFLFVALAAGGMVLWRLGYARIFAQPWFRQRALIVGAGNAGRTLVQAMTSATGDPNPYRGTGYDLLGFIDDDPALAGSQVDGITVVGDHRELADLVRQLAVDEVVLAITHRHTISQQMFDALLRCQEVGVRVSTLYSIYARLLDRVPVEHLGRDLELAIPSKESAGERLYLLLKRIADFACSLLALPLLAVVAALVAGANVFISPGPLFYTQVRVGKRGRHFPIYKFRSMRPDAESDTGAVWAVDNDPRITPVGRLLRASRLDELPQVINILRGEMSLIGPRPERPEFVEQLATEIPFYRARHSLAPGLTGWAQVRYRYGSSHDDARIKLEYDLYYIANTGPLLDLRIVIHTLAIVLHMKGT